MTCLDCQKECSGKRCMACFKKTQEFKVGDVIFNNKTELNKEIKKNLLFSPRNIEFTNPLLISVINNLHEDVIKRNLRVTSLKILDWNGQVGEWEFCRDRFRGGIFIIGFFQPINKWHGVTVYPHRRKNKTAKANLITTLRQKWSEHAIKRNPQEVCEDCSYGEVQLHHDSESFKSLAEKCLVYFSEKELKEGIGDDWWLHETEADAVPNSHPAVQKMLELHTEVNYKWLCSNCHLKAHINLRRPL